MSDGYAMKDKEINQYQTIITLHEQSERFSEKFYMSDVYDEVANYLEGN